MSRASQEDEIWSKRKVGERLPSGGFSRRFDQCVLAQREYNRPRHLRNAARHTRLSPIACDYILATADRVGQSGETKP